MPKLSGLDHLVLTVMDMRATIAFYKDVLGMETEVFYPSDGSTRTALRFGTQKINLHPAHATFDPKAEVPMPGSADLCFLTETPLDAWQSHFASKGIAVEQGPIARSGAVGQIMSLYVRDPDGNLIEVAMPKRALSARP